MVDSSDTHSLFTSTVAILARRVPASRPTPEGAGGAVGLTVKNYGKEGFEFYANTCKDTSVAISGLGDGAFVIRDSGFLFAYKGSRFLQITTAIAPAPEQAKLEALGKIAIKRV